jgi:ornithine--oxo-acid transaminase
MGRTGRFLAAEHWGVEPDLVLLAKALSGGFVPVGAVACRREVFDRVFDRMDRAFVHGSTFAKNDLAMAAGLATLTVLEDEDLIARSADLGARLAEGLRQSLAPFDLVKEVRGKGMIRARVRAAAERPAEGRLRADGPGEQGTVLPAGPDPAAARSSHPGTGRRP